MRWKEFCFVPPASFGHVSSGIFGGDETKIPSATEVTKNKEIKILFAVLQHEKIISSIWEYLECLSPGVLVGYFVNLRHKYGSNNHPHQSPMV